VTAQLGVIGALVFAALVMLSRFEMFCLRDLAETADADLQYLTRQGWMLLILLVIPLGGIMYLYRGKRHSRAAAVDFRSTRTTSLAPARSTGLPDIMGSPARRLTNPITR
jgi:hypothetical protein